MVTVGLGLLSHSSRILFLFFFLNGLSIKVLGQRTWGAKKRTDKLLELRLGKVCVGRGRLSKVPDRRDAG